MQLDLFEADVEDLDNVETKVCIWCHLEKQKTKFGLYNRNADGRDNRCRDCIKHSMGVIERLKLTAPPKPEVCDCCKKVPKKKFVLDHCHEEEKFRGWLCDHCNLAIGLLGDDVGGVERALEYLRNHYEQH